MKTHIIVCCSYHIYNVDETLISLNFAKRSRKIRNIVMINFQRRTEDLENMIESINNKLKIANSEIKKLQTFNRSTTLGNYVSPIKLKLRESIPNLNNNLNPNINYDSNSFLKLAKQPQSLAVENLQRGKSKSLFFDVNMRINLEQF